MGKVFQRGQFTFYRSFYTALLPLPQDLRVRILETIIRYALDGTEPDDDLHYAGKSIFAMVQPTLDTARRKAEAGARGGSKKSTDAEEEEEDDEYEEEEEAVNKPQASAKPPQAPLSFDEKKQQAIQKLLHS